MGYKGVMNAVHHLARAALLCAVLIGAASVAPPAAAQPCDAALLRQLPARAADAAGGSEIARRVEAISGSERDAVFVAELLAGNLPDFLRTLVAVALPAPRGGATVTACVLPDYLAVGSDRDFLLVPMGLAGALAVAQRSGFTLPTTRLVDAIYAQATLRLAPRPLPASDAMRSTAYLRNHDHIVDQQRSAAGGLLGWLIAGHKKDLVLTNRLWRALDRVAIYGWHRAPQDPIQTLSTVHGARYADYSHGVRLVSTVVYVDGAPRPIAAALADPVLAPALSAEGPIPNLEGLTAALSAPPARAAALDTATTFCSSGNPGDSSGGCARP